MDMTGDKPLQRLRLTEEAPRGLKTTDPALFCIELRAMTIYFQQVELSFRRPNVIKGGWLVNVADSNNLIAYHLETCTAKTRSTSIHKTEFAQT